MIVDLHTHFFNNALHWEPQVLEDCRRCGIDPATWAFSVEDHLRETAAVDVAVVFGLRGRKTGWNIPNDIVAEHVARAPERLIFFAAIDPAEPDCMEQLEHCHRQLGAQGVKVAPIYQGIHPLDARFQPIYGYCERESLPILTHAGTTFSSGVPLDFSRPAHWDEVSVSFPDLKIILAHLGHPWEGETIAAIRKQPNLYADLSALFYRPWQFYNTMRLLVEYRADKKVFFGSDFPATKPAESLAGLRNLNHVIARSGLPEVPREVIEGIIHRDALGILGIGPTQTSAN